MSSDAERVPLTEAPRLGQGLWIIGSAALFIGLSAALINYNKFLMQPGYFPYSVPLTWMHMFTSGTFSWILYGLVGDKYYPSMPSVKQNFGELSLRFVPIAVAFAISIGLSNEAYRYCSVPFLQMCKEFNAVLVYSVGLAMATERFKLNTATVLGLVTVGCVLSVHGEMRFNGFGFGLQMGCQIAEVLKIVVQQIVMQGFKLDPLSTVLLLGPECLVCLSLALPFVWEPGILAAARQHWPHLALNCANAFLLNVAVANIIGSASALTMVICGVVKDVMIVLAAAFLFGAEISQLQMIGFTVAILSVMTYSIIRGQPEMASKHGVIRTVAWIVLRVHPPAAAEHAV